MADHIFGFVQTVTYVSGTTAGTGVYTVNGSAEPAINVRISDRDVNGTGDKSYQLGEVTPDTFTYNGKTYTYLGKVPAAGSTTLTDAFVAKASDGTYLLFSDTRVRGDGKTFNESSIVDTPMVICFLPGTQIATPRGEVSVETLQRGDLVQTADGRTAAVRWVGRQTIATLFADPLRVNPICIKAGALAENVPSQDLYVSPDHAILVDDILVHASALVNGTSIVRAPAPASTFTYYHVELADHSLLLADNVPAESFIDNVDRLAFDNWDEHEALGDEAASLAEMAYPRAKSARQVPVAIRERLAARAQTLFGSLATQAA